MTNAALSQVAQSLTPSAPVSLFKLDATSIGATTYFFCQSRYESANVLFGGQSYTAVDVEFANFEVSGAGTLPTPTLTLANSNGVFQNIINTYGDLTGCVVQRVRTFRQFLDGEPGADPTAYFGPDTFRVERKSAENPNFIEWELSASIDQEGKLLPGRVVIRDTCLWRYRRWNPATSSFDYSKVQCPYTGTAYFDKTGNTVSAANDSCGRKVSDCKLRFGSDAVLPFGGFPGAARVHVT
jgi:lambda family phage minor tail protein L